MPSSCVVIGCETKYSNSQVSFHKFPFQNPTLLEKWVACTNRGSNWKPTKWSAICSRHFSPSDFRNFLYRKVLVTNAYPSIECNNISSEQKSYEDDTLQTNMDMVCRFCGQIYLTQVSLINFYTENNVLMMIQKCFPLTNFHEHDGMPRKVCRRCCEKITNFTLFMDEFQRVQIHLESRYLGGLQQDEEEIDDTSSDNIKQLKIKQEPITVIKEEILEPSQRFIPSELMGGQSLSNNDVIEIVQPPLAVINITEENNECNETEISMKFEEGEEEIVDGNCSNNSMIIDVSHLKKESYDDQATDYENEEVNSFEDETDVVEITFYHLLDHNYAFNANEKYENYDKHGSALPACTICNSYFESNKQLQSHQQSFHTHSIQSCSECKIEFQSLYDYLIHKNENHGKLVFKQKKIKQKNKLKPVLKCMKCDQIFKTIKARNNHSKYICKSEEFLFACKNCPKSFHDRLSLKQHKKEYHQDALPVLSLKIRNNVNHLDTINYQPFKNGKYFCKYCNRKYIHFSNLLRHIRTHRPANKWDLICKTCGMVFDKQHDFIQHCRQKVCSRMDPTKTTYFICSFKNCNKEFESWRNLRLHSKTHSNEKPYKCFVNNCERSFRTAMNLYQHKKSHKKLKLFKCMVCDKHFKWKSSLNIHITRFHKLHIELEKINNKK